MPKSHVAYIPPYIILFSLEGEIPSGNLYKVNHPVRFLHIYGIFLKGYFLPIHFSIYLIKLFSSFVRNFFKKNCKYTVRNSTQFTQYYLSISNEKKKEISAAFRKRLVFIDSYHFSLYYLV